jgi:hypothetical protein
LLAHCLHQVLIVGYDLAEQRGCTIKVTLRDFKAFFRGIADVEILPISHVSWTLGMLLN